MKKQNKKVAVALSGGVDSAVATKLLINQGFEVTGFHLQLCDGDGLSSAKAVADQLEINLLVVDLQKYFDQTVIDPFVADYQAGLTPNPCVICNKKVKFGRLLEMVTGEGFDYLATGHYARLKISNGQYRLWSGRDEGKDQAYFLYRLGQSELARVIFPLGDWNKTQTHQFATKHNIILQNRSESQDVCFLAGGDYRSLIGGGQPGPIVTSAGEQVGEHGGLSSYTIGQRKGFEVNPDFKKKFSGQLPAFYVVGKDVGRNRLIVGKKNEAFKTDFWVENLSWVGNNIPEEINWVRIRSTGQRLKVVGVKDSKARLGISLKKAELGVAPGQHAVFYRKHQAGWEVLGGGVISV